MKSKSSKYIIIVVVLIVIIILVYIFAVKGSSSAPSKTPGLVSTNTGTASNIPTSSTSAESPGGQVVALLRNLSVIQLDDSVFRNPSFGLLQDLSIQLPPVTTQGRRNPFAPVGTDVAATPPANTGITFQIPTALGGTKK